MKGKKLMMLFSLISVLILSGCNSDSGNKGEGSEEGNSVAVKVKEEKEKEPTVKVKEKKEEEKKKAEEDNPLNLEITGKTSVPKDTDKWIFSDYITLNFKVINNTDREVKGATFDIKVKDIFDDSLVDLGYKESELNIPPKGFVEASGDWELNQFRNRDYILFDEPLENLQFELVIGTIIYADGEKEVVNDI